MIAMEDRRDLGELGSLGMKAFFAICSHWRLGENACAELLGVSTRSLNRWRNAPPEALGARTLERISHTIAIFHALADLLPGHEARADWVNKPNSAHLFRGATALSVMSAASNRGLREVRCYLESHLGSLPPSLTDEEICQRIQSYIHRKHPKGHS